MRGRCNARRRGGGDFPSCLGALPDPPPPTKKAAGKGRFLRAEKNMSPHFVPYVAGLLPRYVQVGALPTPCAFRFTAWRSESRVKLPIIRNKVESVSTTPRTLQGDVEDTRGFHPWVKRHLPLSLPFSEHNPRAGPVVPAKRLRSPLGGGRSASHQRWIQKSDWEFFPKLRLPKGELFPVWVSSNIKLLLLEVRAV